MSSLLACAEPESLVKIPLPERLSMAEKTLSDLCEEWGHAKNMPILTLIDSIIREIHNRLQTQLDDILHHPAFQTLESTWRSLHKLFKTAENFPNVQISVWSITEHELFHDFQAKETVSQSCLYQYLYTQEFDMPGGEPFAAMIANFDIIPNAASLHGLKNIAQIAALSHCPFIANIEPSFFQKNSFSEVVHNPHLAHTLERADYIYWNQFRRTAESRYIGLCLPKVLSRIPYGENNPCISFHYEENTIKHSDYLWGYASFEFAKNLLKSFHEHGWAVNIRGPESGGKIDDLPLISHKAYPFSEMKIPTETIISETEELILANMGFIPLSYYKNRQYACFFSAHSTQLPDCYGDPSVKANNRLNSRLPYVFLASRLAHYLKVMQRENIGSNWDAIDIERRLNRWIKNLVTKMPNPLPSHRAQYPLKEGLIKVHMMSDNPGYYKVDLYATPHFQMEGMDVRLYLVSQIPNNRTVGA